jgi:tungstate transport system substrate-binding protein
LQAEGSVRALLLNLTFLPAILLLAGAAPATQPRVVRVAVIGGMNETGFWDALAQRFERATGIHVEAVATGPKEGITGVFKQGGIDLITMHASDTIINLVADGWAMNPQPWVKNDMVIVGPTDDPAGIKGETDAAAALRKIAESKSPFVVHSSLGAQEVLRAILDAGDIQLDPDHTTILFDDRQRRVLKIAAEKQAYTLVGRIPFRSGKIPNDGLLVMVQGNARLQRPFVVAVADPAKVPDAHVSEAQRLVDFLRDEHTQAWIGEFGKGKYDDQPLFFPIASRGH